MMLMLRKVLLGGAAVCCLIGAGVTIADVILRWTTGGNIHGVIEVTTLLIGLSAILSMPVCYEMRTHVAAKLLSEMNSRVFERPFAVISALASIIFSAILFFIMSKNTIEKIGTAETSRDLLLPMDYLLAIVSGGFFLSLIFSFIGFYHALKVDVAND